jgi:hypothetical protein
MGKGAHVAVRAKEIAALSEIPGDRVGLVGHLMQEVTSFKSQVSSLET